MGIICNIIRLKLFGTFKLRVDQAKDKKPGQDWKMPPGESPLGEQISEQLLHIWINGDRA